MAGDETAIGPQPITANSTVYFSNSADQNAFTEFLRRPGIDIEHYFTRVIRSYNTDNFRKENLSSALISLADASW
jgi:hypothetical protein